MVLSKQELISALQNEVRILLHLIRKIDKAKLDYRPTAKQRSFLELIQYMAIMGPTMVVTIKGGTFTREAMQATWGPADAAAKAMNFDQAVAAIEKQSGEYARLLGEWSDEEFRSEIDMFGNKSTRGASVVNMILCGHAAYRTQLFCYLKGTGREELNTVNLWMGKDGAM
jgi:DinB family